VPDVADVFIVDHDPDFRGRFARDLEAEGISVRTFDGVRTVVAAARRGELPCVIVSDFRLIDGDGLGLMRTIRAFDPLLPVILVAHRCDVPMAVQAMRQGAADVLDRAVPAARLIESTKQSLALHRHARAPDASASTLEGELQSPLLGESAPMRGVRTHIGTLARVGCDVLIVGETGTGKSVAGRALHEAARSAGPFVALQCAGTPADVLEHELFGQDPGAASGMPRGQAGRIEQARGGTLFIDGIDSMPLTVQARLLRAIDERIIVRSPGASPVRVDCRFVVAAPPDLNEAVAQGRFRGDLFFRLEVMTLRMPPLRERIEDIPQLFRHFLALAARKHGVVPPGWSVEDLLLWQQRPWTGNVRELAGLAERWCLGLERQVQTGTGGAATHSERIERVERTLISAALQEQAGSVQAAAEQLGISRKTLYDKLKRLDIDPALHRPGKS
jgi:two-component system, NtrC family, C4-dicarboxylate transport response regulator DctD